MHLQKLRQSIDAQQHNALAKGIRTFWQSKLALAEFFLSCSYLKDSGGAGLGRRQKLENPTPPPTHAQSQQQLDQQILVQSFIQPWALATCSVWGTIVERKRLSLPENRSEKLPHLWDTLSRSVYLISRSRLFLDQSSGEKDKLFLIFISRT